MSVSVTPAIVSRRRYSQRKSTRVKHTEFKLFAVGTEKLHTDESVRTERRTVVRPAVYFILILGIETGVKIVVIIYESVLNIDILNVLVISKRKRACGSSRSSTCQIAAKSLI